MGSNQLNFYTTIGSTDYIILCYNLENYNYPTSIPNKTLVCKHLSFLPCFKILVVLSLELEINLTVQSFFQVPSAANFPLLPLFLQINATKDIKIIACLFLDFSYRYDTSAETPGAFFPAH